MDNFKTLIPAVEPSKRVERGLEIGGTLAMDDRTQECEEINLAAAPGSALNDEMPVCPSSQKFVSVTLTVPAGPEYEYLGRQRQLYYWYRNHVSHL